MHATCHGPNFFTGLLAAGIRQARLVAYEGVSHGLLVTERDRVTRDLLAFLKS